MSRLNGAFLSLVLLTSLQSYAQVKSVKNEKYRSSQDIDSYNAKMYANYYHQSVVPEKTIMFSAGYSSEVLKAKTESQMPNNKYSGGEIVIGKIFKLDSDVLTTSFLKFNAQENKKSIDEDGSSLASKFTEIGFAQRLSLNIGKSNFKLRPFVEAGIYRGNLHHTIHDGILEIGEEIAYVNSEFKVGYWKYGGAIGVELVASNTIVPYVKFEKLKGSFDKSADIKLEAGGATEKVKVVTNSSRSFDTNKLTIGLGILF